MWRWRLLCGIKLFENKSKKFLEMRKHKNIVTENLSMEERYNSLSPTFLLFLNILELAYKMLDIPDIFEQRIC